MSDARALTELIEESVNKGANTVEQIHREIADLLLNLRFGLLRTRGETAATAAFSALACPHRWKSAGPVGPWVWSTFDEKKHRYDTGDLPSTVSLGPGRGTSPLGDAVGDTCFVVANNPQMPVGGVTWARTAV